MTDSHFYQIYRFLAVGFGLAPSLLQAKQGIAASGQKSE